MVKKQTDNEFNFYLRQIGEKVTRVRRSRGLSIKELSILSLIDEETIKKIERGEIDFDILTIAGISRALKIKLRSIM